MYSFSQGIPGNVKIILTAIGETLMILVAYQVIYFETLINGNSTPENKT